MARPTLQESWEHIVDFDSMVLMEQERFAVSDEDSREILLNKFIALVKDSSECHYQFGETSPVIYICQSGKNHSVDLNLSHAETIFFENSELEDCAFAK